MTWNYRVVRLTYPLAVCYEIHEAYYRGDGTCRALTRRPATAFGNSSEELRGDLQLMLRAFEKPALDYNTLEEV